jgi:molecular chaperone GrpE
MSFGDEALPEEESAYSEAEAAEEAADAAAAADAARTDANAQGNGTNAGNGGTGEGAHSNALAEEADPRELLARERDEYLLALQRTQADFENYRKRIARLQQEQAARASGDIVAKLLPVLDTLDLAEAHLNESLDVSEDAKALRASRAMLLDILLKEGLERVDQAGVPFDPSVHDAVARSEGQPGDGGETIVEEVLRSGYRWKGQGLRAAMVRVRG